MAVGDDPELQAFFRWLLRGSETVEVAGRWPAIRVGFAILEFVRVRVPEPGEFREVCETLRKGLKDRNGELDPWWSHDLDKAEEIFGRIGPTAVIEYSERATAGDEVPSETWDGWLYFVDPARRRSFTVGGQERARQGPIVSGIARFYRRHLREREARLRERVLAFAQEQEGLALIETDGRWPAIRWETHVLECAMAEDVLPRIVGYHVDNAKGYLRESPRHPELTRRRDLFMRLMEGEHPQQVHYASARRGTPRIDFWVDRDGPLVFSTLERFSGSINDLGIVQWRMIPFGTTDPGLVRRFKDLEAEADRADELAHADRLSRLSSEAAAWIGRIRAGLERCGRCSATFEDSRCMQIAEDGLSIYCRTCGSPARR